MMPGITMGCFMKFRIHYTIKGADGSPVEDSIVIEGDTVEEIRNKADAALSHRGGVDPWSEELAA